MKPLALLASVAGVCILAMPSHASQVNRLTSLSPNFSTTLFNLTGTGATNILATDGGVAPGATYTAGLFGYNGSVFTIDDLTVDPNVNPNGNGAGTWITPQLSLDNLTLTENFANGASQLITPNLYDAADPGVPTVNADPLDFAQDINGNYLLDANGNFVPLSGDLTSAAVTLPGTVKSVTLAGVITDNYTPAGQPIPVNVTSIPEASSTALLLASLALVAPFALRARRNRAA